MSPREALAAALELPFAEEGAFVLCDVCLEVHRISRADRAPVYGLDGSAQPADDFATFATRHGEHRLRVLRRSGDAEMLSHARHDPMCRVLWELADGTGHRYVVSFGREDVESPRRYAVRPGRLEVVSETIEVDAGLLRAVVDETLYPHSAPERKLESLVETCRKNVARLSWDHFDPIDEDRDDPDTQLACLPASVAAAVAAEVPRLFSGADGERVTELLRRELRHEIPVVRLLRRYEIRG